MIHWYLREEFEGAALVPDQIFPPDGASGWVRMSVGYGHVLALATDGNLYSWGYNWDGILGAGAFDIQNETKEPEKVSFPPGVTAWMDVFAAASHSLAIGNDCRLYAWGSNDSGQLGIGTGSSQNRPRLVDSIGSLCGIPALITDSSRSRLPDGRFLIEFQSDLNRSYTIQYSANAKDWKNAESPIIGDGDLIGWIDSGQPETESHPSESSTRYYRVVFTP